jgi:hypothetical protein
MQVEEQRMRGIKNGDIIEDDAIQRPNDARLRPPSARGTTDKSWRMSISRKSPAGDRRPSCSPRMKRATNSASL